MKAHGLCSVSYVWASVPTSKPLLITVTKGVGELGAFPYLDALNTAVEKVKINPLARARVFNDKGKIVALVTPNGADIPTVIITE